MKTLKQHSIAFAGSYGIVQAAGLALGSVWIATGGMRGGSDFGFVPLLLAAGFLVTAIPTLIYAAVLSILLGFLGRGWISAVLAAVISCGLTGGVFLAGTWIFDGGIVLPPDNAGLFVCSLLAGLAGAAFVFWYYRRSVPSDDAPFAGDVRQAREEVS